MDYPRAKGMLAPAKIIGGLPSNRLPPQPPPLPVPRTPLPAHTHTYPLSSPMLFMLHANSQLHKNRLRTNCSSLHQHLFSETITDNPLCDCDTFENPDHYL